MSDIILQMQGLEEPTWNGGGGGNGGAGGGGGEGGGEAYVVRLTSYGKV